ncbi:MAG: glucose dehydrogenase [Rhodospirillaceae bacterium]|nr:MAG: glucose dehydrogenase [Rhodospirillaceae bacterium]
MKCANNTSDSIAADIEADVIIVGAGLFGGLMAWHLQSHGFQVAMIDSGPVVDRVEAVKTFKASPLKNGNSAYPPQPYAPIPDEIDPTSYYVQDDHDSKDPKKQIGFNALYLRTVGGTSWHFTGHAERMYPNDFRMKSEYGRGLDWPISYETLEPYYKQVEEAWGVAGNDTCVAPTPHPYPLPYVPLTYLDHQVNKAAEKLNDGVGPLPHCRTSVPYDGRPQCCGNASCRFICPVGAKYDGSVHVQKAVDLDADLYTNHVVLKIEVDDKQNVTSLRFKDYTDPDNPAEGTAKAKLFILAAHAIETPLLLLRSADKNNPNGLANSSDQVGRNLMSMVGINAKAYVPDPVYPYRGPVNATGVFRELRDGAFRKDYGSIGTIVINGGFDPTNGPLNEADDAVHAGLFGAKLRERIFMKTATQVYLDNSVEILPDPDNRVTLSDERVEFTGLQRPNIDIRIDDYTLDGVYVAWKRSIDILKEMGGTFNGPLPDPTRDVFKAMVAKIGVQAGAAMIAGTARMGDDPKTSVVDQWCKSHDHENLFIVGTANYVTAGSVSPSLTAAAISLRAAEYISKNFKNYC